MSSEKDIIARLLDEMPSFSKRQVSIARYICDNCDKAAFMTAGMLSEAAGVSESTVVRFATELGYEGYPGMRRALQLVLRGRLEAAQHINSEARVSPAAEILRQSLNSDAEGIRAAANLKNEACIDAVVNLVMSADELYIAGFDGLSPLAEHMEGSLLLLRRSVRSISRYIYGGLNSICADDVLIILDSADGNAESAGAGRFARDRGAAVIVICVGEQSPASKYADYRLAAENSAAVFGLVNAVAAAAWAAADKNALLARNDIEKIRMEYDGNEQ